MNSFESIIQEAIQLETNSAQLYRTLSEHTNRPEIKKVFLEMEAQEIGHKKKLELVLERGEIPQGTKYTPDEDLKLAETLADIDLNRVNLTYQEALVIGMKLEKISLELYQDLAKKTDDPKLKELFEFLIEEESKHKHSFEANFDDLQP